MTSLQGKKMANPFDHLLRKHRITTSFFVGSLRANRITYKKGKGMSLLLIWRLNPNILSFFFETINFLK